jgi:hypothetical protein
MQSTAMFPTATGRSVCAWIGRNRLMVGAATVGVITAATAWQWSWLAALGIAPLLVSVAPCLAMCALGLCMHRGTPRSCGTDSSTVLPSQNDRPQITTQQTTDGGLR